MKKTAAVVAAIVAVLALLFIATEQTAPPEMTDAEIAQIEAEVTEFGEAWLDAWGPGTTEERCAAAQALAHPDRVVWMRGGEPRGPDGFFDYCMAIQRNWVSYTGEWTDPDVRVLSPDAVIFIGRTSGTWIHTDGRVIRYPAGVVRFLLERTADGWGFTMQDFSNGPSEVVEEG
jgi:hypothetical protein